MYANSSKNDQKNQRLIQGNEDADADIKRESGVSFHKLEQFETDGETPGKMDFLARIETLLGKNVAYYYMIFSAFMMSLNALCAKLTSAIPPFETLFFRSLFLIIILYIYIKYSAETISINDQRTRKSKKLIIFLSGLSLFLGWCYFYGISKMPLSEAIFLIYS